MDITGTDNGETLLGTPNDDNIYGLGGNDIIDGMGGNDVLNGGTGVDTLIGGTGDDLFFVYPFSDSVTELVGGGYDYVVFAFAPGEDRFLLNAGAEIELISTHDNLGTGAVTLVGNEFGQIIVGNAGANYLQGLGGLDTLIGLGGDDGYVVDSDDLIVEAIGGGYDNLLAGADYILAAGVEIEVMLAGGPTLVTAVGMTGNEFGQILLGNQGANYLDGGGGLDRLFGFAGNDTYIVDADDIVVEDEPSQSPAVGGVDIVAAKTSYTLGQGVFVEVLSTTDNAGTAAINLTGNEVAQSVLGNAGNNILDGRGGNDLLVGRGGADSFAFTTALGATNVDRIGDFIAADDTILLDDAVFTGLATGALNANAFVIGTAAADADDRIIYDQGTGRLFFDADGNGAGAAVQFATLTTTPVISASDFTVI